MEMPKRLHYKVIDLNREYTGVIEVYEDSIIISKEEIVNGGGGQAYSTEITWKELIDFLSVNDELQKC
jgi:hypothetical protein